MNTINKVGCTIYDDLSIFNVTALQGPYLIQYDIDYDGIKETLEIRFCNPAYQSSLRGSKSSLIFIRDTTTTNYNKKRILRLTSGSGALRETSTIRNTNGDTLGVKYIPALLATADKDSKVCKINDEN